MAALHFDSATDARKNFKDLLDAADRGRPATVRRDHHTAAVVDAERLRYFLARMEPQASVTHDAGSWWIYFSGLPISADGATLDEAVDDAVTALREYAEDWQDRLSSAPNHEGSWGLVQLVSLSDDDQLRDWLRGV